MKSNTKYLLGVAFIVTMIPFLTNGQDFPADYFAPKPIIKQNRSNNSFFYSSYGQFMNLDIDEIIDYDFNRIKKSEKYTVAWFNQKDPTSNKGFELMFTAEMWNPIRKLESETYFESDGDFKTFTLKIGSVGKKGATAAFLHAEIF